MSNSFSRLPYRCFFLPCRSSTSCRPLTVCGRKQWERSGTRRAKRTSAAIALGESDGYVYMHDVGLLVRDKSLFFAWPYGKTRSCTKVLHTGDEALVALLPSDRHDFDYDSIVAGGTNLRCAQNTPRHQQEIYLKRSDGGTGHTNKIHSCGISRVSM